MIRATKVAKVRINDLAKELELKSRQVLECLPLLGIAGVKTHSSSLEDWEAARVRVHFEPSSVSPRNVPRFTTVDKSNVSGEARAVAIRPRATISTKSDEIIGAPSEHDQIRSAAWPQPASGSRPTVRKSMLQASGEGRETLIIPEVFSFYTPGFLDFDHILQYFDWSPCGSR